MNRIRKHNDKYQVLITPHHMYDPYMELVLGNWRDEHLKGYYVYEFDTLNDAQVEAFKHPDIRWEKLTSDHIECFRILKNTIKETLDLTQFIVEFNAHLKTPIELKETMFNRIIGDGERFRLNNDFNDIIGFSILNPWFKNCVELSKILEKTISLRITKKYIKDKVIYLIGETDIGTTFEITLWPTIIFNVAKWKQIHKNVPSQVTDKMLSDAIKLQDLMDGSMIIR